jgi:hypothetical protein
MTLDEVGRWRDAAAHMCDRLVALLPEDQREDHRLTEDGYDVGIGPGTLPDLAAKVVRHVAEERDRYRAALVAIADAYDGFSDAGRMARDALEALGQ